MLARLLDAMIPSHARAQNRSRIRWGWCVLTTLSVLAGCGGDRQVRSAGREFLDSTYARRELDLSIAGNVLQFLTRDITYTAGDSVPFETPSAVAIRGAPVCKIAVADRDARAVHIFDLDGSPRVTVRRMGRGRAGFGAIESVAFLDNGALIVSDWGWQRATLFDSTGHERGEWEFASPVHPGTRSHLVSAGPAGTILDHWFGSALPTASSDWSAQDLPLVQVLDSTGKVVGRVGRLRAYPGHALPAMMNHGYAGMAKDTIWFMRASDATALGFPIAGPQGMFELRSPVVVRLPLYFKMNVPYEQSAPGGTEYFPVVQEHLLAFSVTPGGNFVMAQVIGYPRPDDQTTVEPVNALTLIDRTSGRRYKIGMPGRIFDLAATDEVIVAVVYDESAHTRHVLLLRTPWAPGQESACRRRGSQGSTPHSSTSQ